MIDLGLTVDTDKELVYVIDGNTHRLVVVKFDGSDFKNILFDANKIKHPFSLALMKVSCTFTCHLCQSCASNTFVCALVSNAQFILSRHLKTGKVPSQIHHNFIIINGFRHPARSSKVTILSPYFDMNRIHVYHFKSHTHKEVW